jgi:hypothetical protein
MLREIERFLNGSVLIRKVQCGLSKYQTLEASLSLTTFYDTWLRIYNFEQKKIAEQKFFFKRLVNEGLIFLKGKTVLTWP